MSHFLSDKTKAILFGPLNKKNPVLVQVLGICSALAVTTKLEAALIMGICVIVVVAFANLFISLLRHYIPDKIRIIVQLVIAAFLVTLVNEFLKAYAFEISQQLSVFISLILTNCILMGRLEAFALGNGPVASFLDGIGNGLGYAVVLFIIGFVRELLGSGTLLGIRVIPEAVYNIGYMDNGLMILPPMALITVAVIIWIQRSRNKDLQEEA